MVWPTPYFPSYSGPYTVGTFDLEVPSADVLPSAQSHEDIPETVSCRVFYPAENQKTHHARPVYWIQSPQRGIVSAYGQFLGASPRFAHLFSYFPQILYHIKIPAIRNAKLHQSPHQSGRWPVVVFSHGLGGTRNAYSHVCGSLASYGLVVVAPDHRDGSSPIQYIRATDKTPARTVDYKSYSHKPSPDVYNGRDEQLKIRIAELSMIHEILHRADAGKNIRNLDPNHAQHKAYHSTSSTNLDKDLLSMFAGKLDIHEPGKITFAGHSFGAATTIQFVKSVFYHSGISTPILALTPTKELKEQISPQTPVILLDPWGLPLQSPATSALKRKPMPCFSDSASSTSDVSPVLAILSSAFFNWTSNLNQIKSALANPDASEKSSKHAPAHIFYPSQSAHLSQSDFGILFPNVTKYLARAAEPERTLRLNVRAILQVMRQNNIAVADTTPADMELTGESEKDEAQKGDWRILSTQEGCVRGWVSVSADDVGDNDSKAYDAARKMDEKCNSPEMAKVRREKNADSAANEDSLGNDELAEAR